MDIGAVWSAHGRRGDESSVPAGCLEPVVSFPPPDIASPKEESRSVRSTARTLCLPRQSVGGHIPSDRGGLVARSRELAEIDHLLGRVRRASAGAIGFRGECGVGKSALVEAAVARATDLRTVQIRGAIVAGAAAGRDVVSTWPDPLQELAARVADPSPEQPRFASPGAGALARRAVSAVVVEAAASSLRRLTGAGPLLISIDDCQVLPRELVVALAAAVVGPLCDEPVGLLLAWRDTPHLEPFELGLQEVVVHELGGLTVSQSRELLSAHCDKLPDDAVLSELVGRTGGNPLVLLGACCQLTVAELAGWHPLPDPLPLGPACADGFNVGRLLPPATRRTLAVVAAGSAPTKAVVQAMDRVGVTLSDLAPALDAGVVYQKGTRIGFRHPLVRSAAFYGEPADVRREIRRALSDVLADAGAIEASACHAGADVVGVDALAARRLAEAASVALDRGDPASAASYEELAAGCAASPDEAMEHLADAAAHWASTGEPERARHCLDAGTAMRGGPSAMAELNYQRARLTRGVEDETVPAQMVAAATACAGDLPNRALAMLLDAAAWWLLADEPAEAERAADRAVRLAGTVSSHFELLGEMVRAAARIGAGEAVNALGERSRTSLLVGGTTRFVCSPEVAFVIGRSLLRQGIRRQAERWSQWIARCAQRSGDVSLAAVPPLLDCSIGLADGDVVAAAAALERCPVAPDGTGTLMMQAQAWQLSAMVHALAGDYDVGLRAAIRAFSIPDGVVGAARLQALPALVLLELQRGHLDAAVAWARIGKSSLAPSEGTRPVSSATFALVAPFVASVPLLARSCVEPQHCAGFADDDGVFARVPKWCRAWLDAICETDDPTEAVALFDATVSGLGDHLLLQMVAELCRAARLTDAGLLDVALDSMAAVERRANRAGAKGLAAIATLARGRLPGPPSSDASRAPGVARGALDATLPGYAATDRITQPSAPALPEWEISVLGAFSVRRNGKLLSLPASLATQAIKIAAVRPRLTVDEMIELLWEEAEPSVGTRRLRNVLWRIRSLCGDLLVREDGHLRLASSATTDLQRFNTLAEQALIGPQAGTPPAVDLARAALDCYRGELLPGDRYADWSTAARESGTRTYLRLLDLLVDDALGADRPGEALALLDRLAELDPYDERHHLRTAQIHLDAGNRGRALGAIEHAERMLADLGVAPSPAVRRLRAELHGS